MQHTNSFRLNPVWLIAAGVLLVTGAVGTTPSFAQTDTTSDNASSSQQLGTFSAGIAKDWHQRLKNIKCQECHLTQNNLATDSNLFWNLTLVDAGRSSFSSKNSFTHYFDPQSNQVVSKYWIGVVSTRAENIRFRIGKTGKLGDQDEPETTDDQNALLAVIAAGVEVKTVTRNSPAAKAGLKEGDIIVELDHQLIQSRAQLVKVVDAKGNQSTAGLLVRNEQLKRFSITPQKRPNSDRDLEVSPHEIVRTWLDLVQQDKPKRNLIDTQLLRKIPEKTSVIIEIQPQQPYRIELRHHGARHSIHPGQSEPYPDSIQPLAKILLEEYSLQADPSGNSVELAQDDLHNRYQEILRMLFSAHQRRSGIDTAAKIDKLTKLVTSLSQRFDKYQETLEKAKQQH